MNRIKCTEWPRPSVRVCRNHCPGNDPGLLPVHAAQPRVGLPRAGSGDKTDKNASFRYKAYLEEIDYTVSRGLDRNRDGTSGYP